MFFVKNFESFVFKYESILHSKIKFKQSPNPTILVKAKEELMQKRGADFQYKPLIGDRKPPLDYRKGM